MNEPPLDELYLTWLYSQVGSVKIKNPEKTYWSLLRLLYSKEFIWIVPNDDNRVADGRELRFDFIDEEGLFDVDDEWMSLGCSMLEMLVALSRRLSFESEGEPRVWFWHILRNIGLEVYNDTKPIPFDAIDEQLNQIIWRTYEPDGTGGLFPLQWPEKDQRDIEIWYQLSAYILERGL